MTRRPERSTLILMGLFAVTLLTYFVIRLGAEDVIPSKPASETSTTAKPTPRATTHQTDQTEETNSRPRMASTDNARLGGRRNSSAYTPVPTLTIAPVPIVTEEPLGAPAPTAVPPGEVAPPPVDIPEPDPAPAPAPDPAPAPEPVTP